MYISYGALLACMLKTLKQEVTSDIMCACACFISRNAGGHYTMSHICLHMNWVPSDMCMMSYPTCAYALSSGGERVLIITLMSRVCHISLQITLHLPERGLPLCHKASACRAAAVLQKSQAALPQRCPPERQQPAANTLYTVCCTTSCSQPQTSSRIPLFIQTV